MTLLLPFSPPPPPTLIGTHSGLIGTRGRVPRGMATDQEPFNVYHEPRGESWSQKLVHRSLCPSFSGYNFGSS